jgi:RNA polymerase sigma-70 factor (ECF subfamily)
MSASGAPESARAGGESDEELIRGCACGEEGAFARLLERYRARVSQLVRWHLGPRSLWADDVAQDVFVQVHRNARRFEGRSSFKTWLYSVAMNVCRDHVRRERNPVRRRGAGDPGEHVLAAIPDATLDPLERLERDEQRALVRAAVERLSPVHRTALQLRDWEELSYEEMAEVLHVAVGTVRSRLHNARMALARELAASLKR